MRTSNKTLRMEAIIRDYRNYACSTRMIEMDRERAEIREKARCKAEYEREKFYADRYRELAKEFGLSVECPPLPKRPQEKQADPIPQKECSICHKTLPITKFYRVGHTKYSFHYCKECHKEKTRKFRLQQQSV